MSTRRIEPPSFGLPPPIVSGMSRSEFWDYACLVGYRTQLSEYDRRATEAERDAARWRQIQYMNDERMVAPHIIADYISKPERIDFVYQIRMEHEARASVAPGERT